VAPINEPSRFLLDWVRDSLAAPAANRLPARRLYLSRSGSSRKVANEPELYAALEPHGFEFVQPGELPFREQVRLFSQTRMAVGPHGANFAGGIFSPRMTALEFFQPAHVNWSVCAILSGVGHEHWHLHCPSVRALGRRRFRDMRVPVELVLETLRRVDGGSA
jgi:capsular polysaccharide biosynthesis protein